MGGGGGEDLGHVLAGRRGRAGGGAAGRARGRAAAGPGLAPARAPAPHARWPHGRRRARGASGHARHGEPHAAGGRRGGGGLDGAAGARHHRHGLGLQLHLAETPYGSSCVEKSYLLF